MPVARILPTPPTPADVEKFQVELIGAKNGVNVTYLVPDKFNEEKIRVYRNGVRQMRDDVGACDIEVEESGGPGTGFDTIIFVDRAPVAGENLFADYVVASS